MTLHSTSLRTLFMGLVILISLSLSISSPTMAQVSGADVSSSGPDTSDVLADPIPEADAEQDESQQYYQAWLRTAKRAETVIEAGRASTAALEDMRLDLAEFRDRFRDVQSENDSRIKTLQAQIETLGPAPESGEAEPKNLAQLRARLTQQLTELRVPRIISEEASLHASGLINEVDQIIRDRRKSVLLQRGATPLNPANWSEALNTLTGVLGSLATETKAQFNNDAMLRNLGTRWPSLLVLALIGVGLTFGGRYLAVRGAAFLRAQTWRGTGVWSFVASLLQMGMPYLGVSLIVAAINEADILGVRGTLLLQEVPRWALTFLAFHWLGRQLFANRLGNTLLPIDPKNATATWWMLDLLALLLISKEVLQAFEHVITFSDGALAVVRFPLIVIAALVLLRLRRIGAQQRAVGAEEGADQTTIAAGANLIISIVRRGAYLLGFVSPILAALGYIDAAEAMIYPAIYTLAVIATLLVVQRFLVDLYGFVSGQGGAASDTLGAVLIGFLLTALAVPILALVWGVRYADLFDLWSSLLTGFQIGDTTISPTGFVTFAVVFGIGYTVTRLVQGSLRTSLLPKTKIDPGGQNAIVSGTGYVGILLAALIAISSAGLDLSSLAIVAGALSVGIGFGLQTIVSNFVSGIILLIERPISKGDWIEVGGMMGYVRDISVRSTRIETFDRTDVIVPNSDLITGTVTNFTRGNTVGRVIVPVGVAYGTDPRRIEAILMEIAKSHPMVLAQPGPSVVFQGFGADSLDFEIRAILRDVNWMLSVKSDLNYQIADRFAQEGIEIPFAQRDLWIRNPEALTGQMTAAKS